MMSPLRNSRRVVERVVVISLTPGGKDSQFGRNNPRVTPLTNKVAWASCVIIVYQCIIFVNKSFKTDTKVLPFDF
jgi:hypothetical protein